MTYGSHTGKKKKTRNKIIFHVDLVTHTFLFPHKEIRGNNLLLFCCPCDTRELLYYTHYIIYSKSFRDAYQEVKMRYQLLRISQAASSS